MTLSGRAGRTAYVVPVVLAVACAANPSPAGVASRSCAVGDTALVREVVYFGRNRPDGGVVSDTEWRRFLDEVFTPRFPAGLTVIEATGQWRGETGVVEQERSEVVTLLHAGDATALHDLDEVVTEYKRRFRQEAVLRERTPTCARFE
ncbi:MAG TPA: DUF3574 domain-containing protein [Gemmatimonadales bacterium]|jgi:hypothetical protein